MSKLLDIQGLRVHFDTLDGPVEALHSVSLSVNEGEIMGVELDGANQKVVLDNDSDTYLQASTDDTLDIYIAGAKDFVITAETNSKIIGNQAYNLENVPFVFKLATCSTSI